MRGRWGCVVVALSAIAMLSGCSASGGAASPSPTVSAAAASPGVTGGLGEISYCVGESIQFKAGQTARVWFVCGSHVLGSSDVEVPMRVSLTVNPGPFTVVVDDQPMFSGTVGAGQVASGSDGDNCPAVGQTLVPVKS